MSIQPATISIIMKRSRSSLTESEKSQDGKQPSISTNTTAADGRSNEEIARQQKRPRTERYLLEVKRLETRGETVNFFQRQLKAMGSRGSTSLSASSILQSNLAKNWKRQQERFHSFHQELLDDAQSVIDMKNGVESMQRYVMEPDSSSTSLQSLNRGHETTAAFFHKIASFAGKPSNAELSDCEQLIAIACTEDR